MDAVDDVLLEADDKMGKAVEFLAGEFNGLRTGKASPTMMPQ